MALAVCHTKVRILFQTSPIVSRKRLNLTKINHLYFVGNTFLANFASAKYKMNTHLIHRCYSYDKSLVLRC